MCLSKSVASCNPDTLGTAEGCPGSWFHCMCLSKSVASCFSTLRLHDCMYVPE